MHLSINLYALSFKQAQVLIELLILIFCCVIKVPVIDVSDIELLIIKS